VPAAPPDTSPGNTGLSQPPGLRPADLPARTNICPMQLAPGRMKRRHTLALHFLCSGKLSARPSAAGGTPQELVRAGCVRLSRPRGTPCAGNTKHTCRSTTAEPGRNHSSVPPQICSCAGKTPQGLVGLFYKGAIRSQSAELTCAKLLQRHPNRSSRAPQSPHPTPALALLGEMRCQQPQSRLASSPRIRHRKHRELALVRNDQSRENNGDTILE